MCCMLSTEKSQIKAPYPFETILHCDYGSILKYIPNKGNQFTPPVFVDPEWLTRISGTVEAWVTPWRQCSWPISLTERQARSPCLYAVCFQYTNHPKVSNNYFRMSNPQPVSRCCKMKVWVAEIKRTLNCDSS